MHYRTALITGGSSGIGRALAVRLAAQGTHVVLCARRAAALQEVAAEIKRGGGQATVCALDLLQTERAVALIRQVDQQLGGLELIIANAGIAVSHPPAPRTWEALADMLRLNFEGAVATLTAVLPDMLDRGGGHLVGISSLSGYFPAPGAAAYCASKAGLSAFLEGLRLELHGKGVKVTAVHPGWVRTPSMQNPGFPTPGLMECDAAADYIISRLPAAPARLDFPWHLAAVAHAARFIPRPLLHALLRRTRWVR